MLMNPQKQTFWALALSSTFFLTGCGGGGGDSVSDTGTDASGDTGELELMVTDAEEDFITYQVTIDEIELVRQDGSRVNVMSTATEVDFVQYQELSELFAVASIPAGTYETVVMTLDYTDADIVVQDENGQNHEAEVVDTEGNVVTTLDVSLSLNDSDQVVITPGRVARLTVDLDLGASNEILSFDPARVEVEPFILGRALVDEDRERRVRGLLASVDETAESITLDLFPMRRRVGEFGDFTFAVDSQTRYEIDGTELTGSEGLSALAALPAETPVVAFNQPDDQAEIQTADRVLAGSSVAWAGRDVLKGIVRARNGNSLTIGGAVVEPEGEAAAFLDEIILTVDEETPVTGYTLGEADIDQLSVGTSILALGQFEEDGFTADADGLVRMQVTRAVGQVNVPEPLSLDLSTLNRRAVERFDFTGTGMTAAEDADPADYAIDTATLDTSGIDAQEWVQVRGYPAAFGSAPADFEALSLVNPSLDTALARFISHWDEDAVDGVNVEGNDLVLDTSQARAGLRLRGLPAAITSQFDVAVVTGEAQGRFALLVRGEGIRVFGNYIDFVTALQVELGEGKTVAHLAATGSYDDSSETLTAGSIQVRM